MKRSDPLPPGDADAPRRKRRRPSIWTLLAPAALVAVIVLTFNALGSSCLVKDCGEKASSSDKNTPAQEAQAQKRKEKAFLYDGDQLKPRWRVREGENAETIADNFELTLDELKACNPNVLDIRQLRTGQILQVAHKHCKGKTPDSAGATVDPTAGTPAETASGDGGR